MIGNGWLSWQIDYLLLLQNLRDVTHHIFDNFFLTITMLGEVTIPLVFMSCIYWCINKRIGIFIIWNYVFGFLTNMFLKTTACIHRPWILDNRVHPLEAAVPAATGYSFPSGHTAGALSTWGGTAISFWNNKFIRYFCITLIFLVMFSRNYVGVHTPQDVIVSFFIGIILLYCTYKLVNWTFKDDGRKNKDLIVTIIVTIISFLVLVYINLKSYPISCLYDPNTYKIEVFGRIGFICGIFWGCFFENRFVNFEPKNGTIVDKIIRLLVGYVILSLLFDYSTIIFKPLGLRTGLFLGNLLTGLYITFIYPLMIQRCSKEKSIYFVDNASG